MNIVDNDFVNVVVQLAAFATAAGILSRVPPFRSVFRWLWRRNISQPVTSWADAALAEVVNREINGKLVRVESKLDEVADEQTAHNLLDNRRFEAGNRVTDNVAASLAAADLKIASVAAELVIANELLADRAKIHDQINEGVVNMLKADLLVKVAEDIAEIKEALPKETPE